MNSRNHTDDSGYSPPISIELHLHGERFNVASVGPHGAVLRDARTTKPGTGSIRIDVDGRVTVYDVNLYNGINPNTEKQRFELLGLRDEVAA